MLLLPNGMRDRPRPGRYNSELLVLRYGDQLKNGYTY